LTSRHSPLPADAARSSWAALGLRAVGLVLSLLLLQASIAPSFAAAATAPSGLLVSSSAKRSKASDLNGAILSGTVWVFVPSSDVRKVEFYLDDPSAEGDPFRTDKDAPLDLAG
jgi:hypothetical protein